MKRILLAFLLLIAGPALADPVPGTWDVGEQTISFPIIGADGVYNEVNGDGSNANGGVPPAFSIQPANIPSTVTTQVDTSVSTTGPEELKFRFSQYGLKVDSFDLIKGFCQRSFGHLHEFVGPKSLGACSTYTQIRTDCVAAHNAGRAATTNAGDDINCSAYWHSAFIDMVNGVPRAKRLNFTPLYYQIEASPKCQPLFTPPYTSYNTCQVTTIANRYVDLPMQLNYISGKSFDDPYCLKMKNAVNIANAARHATAVANGYGYTYNCSQINNTGVRWVCNANSQEADNLADITCPAGSNITEELHGKGCWDGKNLSSPSGEDHVTGMVSVAASNGTWNDVCPKNWYHIPALVDKTEWTLRTAISSSVAGDEPTLASDAAFQAAVRAQAGVCVGSGATQSCAPSDASTFVCKPGCSGHFDYVVAWDKKFLRRAFRKCLGVPRTSAAETGLDADQTVVGTACNDNTLSTTSGTTSRLTSVNLIQFPDVSGDRLQEYYPTPIQHTGPQTIKH